MDMRLKDSHEPAPGRNNTFHDCTWRLQSSKDLHKHRTQVRIGNKSQELAACQCVCMKEREREKAKQNKNNLVVCWWRH